MSETSMCRLGTLVVSFKKESIFLLRYISKLHIFLFKQRHMNYIGSHIHLKFLCGDLVTNDRKASENSALSPHCALYS